VIRRAHRGRTQGRRRRSDFARISGEIGAGLNRVPGGRPRRPCEPAVARQRAAVDRRDRGRRRGAQQDVTCEAPSSVTLMQAMTSGDAWLVSARDGGEPYATIRDVSNLRPRSRRSRLVTVTADGLAPRRHQGESRKESTPSRTCAAQRRGLSATNRMRPTIARTIIQIAEVQQDAGRARRRSCRAPLSIGRK
jgi:hypothetical protein